ncbi:hypothetical protein SH449x_003242 [Pirellulaceae bacterium SH449]
MNRDFISKANIDHARLLHSINFSARRVQGRTLTHVGIAIECPDGFIAKGDADRWKGTGTLQMRDSILKFGFATVETELGVQYAFHMDHAYFCSPNVVIRSTVGDKLFVIRQRRIWSSTLDAFMGNKQVGTFASDPIQSECKAMLDEDVPLQIGLVAIWCIMIRSAFAA